MTALVVEFVCRPSSKCYQQNKELIMQKPMYSCMNDSMLKTTTSLGIISALSKYMDPKDIGYFKLVGRNGYSAKW